MSDYFRDVRLVPPDWDGDARITWYSPDHMARLLWFRSEHYGGAEGALAAATEMHARLTSPLLDPLPEGSQEHPMTAPIRPDDPELAKILGTLAARPTSPIWLAARAWRDHGIMPDPTSPWLVEVKEPDKDGCVYADLRHGDTFAAVLAFGIKCDDPTAVANDLKRRLTATIPAPLPEGMEHAVVATGDVIRRHGWKWRWPGVQSDWLPADFIAPPRHDTRYECRPPQQAPQMVAVMLPADVARQWACGDTYADDEIVAAACRAALTEGDES